MEKGKKVLIYATRKGLYGGLQCSMCSHIPYCKHCDIPIAIHRNNHNQLFGVCTICQELYTYPQACCECGSALVDGYGVGTQQIESWCAGIGECLVLQSAQSHVAKTLDQVSQIQTAQIIVTTSFLQSPIIPNLGLIVVHSGAQARSADYSANVDEMVFLMNIMHNQTDHIIIQTRDPKGTIARAIMEGTEQEFLQKDAIFRLKHNYPPHGELALLIYKHEIESAMYSRVHKLFQDMMQLKLHDHYSDIELYAIPAHVYRAHNKFRFQIVVKGPCIREFIDKVILLCKPLQRGFKVDRGARGFM